MSIASGFTKMKNYILTSSGYKLLSRWTSSQTVHMGDGTDDTDTVEYRFGAMKGVTSSLATDNDEYALSASAGKNLQDQCTQLNQSLTIMNNLNVHMIVGKGSYGWYHTNSAFVGKIKSINITHISIVGDASNNYEPPYHNNINYDNGGITFDIINGFLTMKFSDERIVNLIPCGTVVGIKGVILR